MPSQGSMSCPHCAVPLSMSDRAGIEIDFCPQCRGVWLDRGELDKILERSRGDQPAAPPPPQQQAPAYQQPQQQSYQQPYHGKPYHKKRKGWLEEIFD